MDINLPVYELLLGDKLGVTANAIVSDPAHGASFLKFSKEQPAMKFSSDEMKHNITGPLIIPDLLIYRRNKEIGEFYVKFSKDQVEQIVKRFAKGKLGDAVNVEHEFSVDGAYQIESWIVGEQDKAFAMGFDVPVGTWMSTFHIENESLWSAIMAGEFKGFSIEGNFDLHRVEMSKEPTYEEQLTALLQDETLSDEELNKRIDELNSAEN